MYLLSYLKAIKEVEENHRLRQENEHIRQTSISHETFLLLKGEEYERKAKVL